ncbi:MAG: cobyric acid synthase CobQ, partial [Caulobacteraceae bacterium]|nr:cobyric acid synthase CobQ [Caulobacteraceae bacterium]
MGGYVHGLFQAGGFRAAFLAALGARSSGVDHGTVVDAALDEIAGVLEASLDVTALARIAGVEMMRP